VTVVSLDTRRRDKIGGSEAASACGVDPFRSRIMLWAEKTGRIERPETEAMKWGKLLEPVVFQELERQGFDVVPAPDVEWSDDVDLWMVGHPDGFVDIDGLRGVLEIKTTNVFASHDWNSDAGAPLAYLVQVHHYMALTGLNVALLACLVGGQRLELRIVYRDVAIIGAMMKREREMLDYVRTDRPPPPDGSKSAGDAIRALYSETGRATIRLSGDGYDAVKELRARKEQRKIIERQEAELEQRIQLEMGDAWAAISPYDENVAEWGMVDGHRFDTKRFRADHPEFDLDYYMPTRHRRFVLK